MCKIRYPIDVQYPLLIPVTLHKYWSIQNKLSEKKSLTNCPGQQVRGQGFKVLQNAHAIGVP
jgi:hypothetical protein